jgi:hypothetical protein
MCTLYKKEGSKKWKLLLQTVLLAHQTFRPLLRAVAWNNGRCIGSEKVEAWRSDWWQGPYCSQRGVRSLDRFFHVPLGTGSILMTKQCLFKSRNWAAWFLLVQTHIAQVTGLDTTSGAARRVLNHCSVQFAFSFMGIGIPTRKQNLFIPHSLQTSALIFTPFF